MSESSSTSNATTPEKASPERQAQLEQLAGQLGYLFSDWQLLDRALTHKSFSNLLPDKQDYESLEFLGDAILGFVISETLYRENPDLSEGQLSRIKAFLVSRKQLHLVTARLGAGEALLLSPGEEKTGGRRKKALLADLFESLTAAIYLDGGLNAARSFILRQFADLLKQIASKNVTLKDHKSRLQERLHAEGGQPHYRVAEETGPDHRKRFSVEVLVGDKVVARGEGTSKKSAQQKAAAGAIEWMDADKGDG